MKAKERARAAIETALCFYDIDDVKHPSYLVILKAIREAEAVMKERCAKVAEGELSATDRVVQSEIAHRIRALE